MARRSAQALKTDPNARRPAVVKASRGGGRGGPRRLDTSTTPVMRSAAVEYLRSRLAKPPDGRHDPRVVFGSGLTMERIQSTIYSADWGNPRALTDLSRETLQLDPHLSAVLTKRIGAVASLPIEVIPAEGPGIEKKRAEFFADVVRTQIQRIPNMKAAVRQLAWGLFDGRAVLEKQWAVAPGAPSEFGQVKWVVSMLSWIHPRRVFFGPDRELRCVDRPIGIGFTKDGIAFRDFPHKFVEFTPQLFAEYPEREGLSRPCLYWAFFKRFGARERMIMTELFAKPWRWGEVESELDLSPQEIEDLDTVVEQIAGNGYGRLPRGTKLHVEQVGANVGAQGSIHKEVIDQSDAQISKLVLGQTGTTDAKAQGLGGNQSVVMQDEQAQICLSDASMIEEILEDYLGDDIIEVNFGPSAVTHAPRIKLHADTLDRTKELGRAKAAVDLGLPIALSEAYEISGFRTPSADEPVIRIDNPPATGGGGGVGPDGFPLPAPTPTARAVIAYPAGKAPAARVQEVPTQVTTKPGASVGTEVKDPVVGSPDETDPDQTGEATGNDPEKPTNEIQPSGQKGVVSRDETTQDSAPRGVMTKTVAAGKKISAVGDVPSPEKDRSPAPPTNIHSEGLGDTEDEELEDGRAKVEGAVEHAFAISGGAVTEAGARRLVTSLGSQAAETCILAMREQLLLERPAKRLKQPSSVYGSLEPMVAKTVKELALQTRAWADEIAKAGSGKETPSQIYSAVYSAGTRLDLDEFVRALRRRILQGEMLGILDSHFERNTDETIAPAKFDIAAWQAEIVQLVAETEPETVELAAVATKPSFADLAYKPATEFFKKKEILPKSEFEKLADGAKARAFTVARMSNRGLLDLVHAELGRMISEGADLKDFRKFMNERVVSAGWVPASPSHIETVARTNLSQAHAVGRLVDATHPTTLVDRPYWQIRGVGDVRARATHTAVNGWVLRADDPFFQLTVPGCFDFNCRCRFATLSKKQVEKMGLQIRSGHEIKDLPAKGFAGSGAGALLSSFGAR